MSTRQSLKRRPVQDGICRRTLAETPFQVRTHDSALLDLKSLQACELALSKGSGCSRLPLPDQPYIEPFPQCSCRACNSIELNGRVFGIEQPVKLRAAC